MRHGIVGSVASCKSRPARSLTHSPPDPATRERGFVPPSPWLVAASGTLSVDTTDFAPDRPDPRPFAKPLFSSCSVHSFPASPFYAFYCIVVQTVPSPSSEKGLVPVSVLSDGSSHSPDLTIGLATPNINFAARSPSNRPPDHLQTAPASRTTAHSRPSLTPKCLPISDPPSTIESLPLRYRESFRVPREICFGLVGYRGRKGTAADESQPVVCIYAGLNPPQSAISYEPLLKMEATFVPGGHDDYQMPEMYAPSPQR